MTRKYLTTHLLAWVVGVGAAVGCEGNEDVLLTPLTQSGRGGSGGAMSTTTGAGGTSSTTGSGGTVVSTAGAGGTGGKGGSGGTAATGGTGGTAGGAGGTAGRGGAGGTAGGAGGTAGGAGGIAGGAGGTAGGAGGTAGTTTCGSLGTANNGSGSFTFYYFGQGTPKNGPGGTFLTACGYFGSESGMTDTVQSIANTAPASNTYFAAIPGASGSNFSTVNSCGACVQVTNGGRSIIATVIDECPQDSNPPCASNPNGHLDLSVAAFNALGYSVGNPSGTTWSFVPCPVSGNVITRIKSGNPNQIFIENSVLAITGVSMNGAAGTHLSYGAWQLNANVAGQTLVLTDRAGRTLSVPISGAADQAVDTGRQFPRCQ